MSVPPIVAIYGNSDSGKTELVSRLVEDFIEEGLGVCTIKHSPGEISLDQKGKDTWRHREAGARLTVFSTKTETDFLLPEELEPKEIIEVLSNFASCELVIAEGYKNAKVPKVSIGDIKPGDGTIHEFDGNLETLKETIRAEIEIVEIENELPGLDCGRCGYESCRELARAIREKGKKLEDCQVREEKTVELEVDGKKVPLENFPAEFVKGGVKGMLRSLKGVDGELSSISLEIKE